MKLLACLLIGGAVGVALGGRQALRRARRHDFAKAVTWLQLSAVAAALASCAACFFILGWPWRPVEVNVAQEVSRTVTESVDEVVDVTRWWIYKSKKTVTHEQPREVKETIMHHTTAREFDPWLVPAIGFVAVVSSCLELAVLRIVWA